MNNPRKGGFTLIELLVVIAIIAILAAILFPVFAQAKVAAKKIVAINSVKQMALASIMYQTDYDDMFVPKLRLGYGPAQGGGDPTVAMTFDKLLEPYLKNFEIFASQMDPRPRYNSPYGLVRRSYGVASNVFRGVQINPTWGWGTNWKGSIGSSSVPEPAGTIAFGERRQRDRGIANLWTDWEWMQEVQMNNSRRDDLPSTDPRAPWGEISNNYSSGAVWSYVDGHAKYHRLNGAANDGVLHGTKFPGYEEKAAQWVGSPDPFWDRGLSCFDSGWIAGDGDCKLPGQ